MSTCCQNDICVLARPLVRPASSNSPEVYPPTEGAQAMSEADIPAAYGFGIKELVPV